MTKKVHMLPADAVKELARRHGAKETSERLGVSDSFVYKAQKDGNCTQPVELAARFLLSKEDKTPTAALAICRVPPSKKEMFEALMRGCELRWSWFKEGE